jgi:hypothetical protein
MRLVVVVEDGSVTVSVDSCPLQATTWRASIAARSTAVTDLIETS